MGSFLGGRELLQDQQEGWNEPCFRLPQATEKDAHCCGVSTQAKAKPMKGPHRASAQGPEDRSPVRPCPLPWPLGLRDHGLVLWWQQGQCLWLGMVGPQSPSVGTCSLSLVRAPEVCLYLPNAPCQVHPVTLSYVSALTRSLARPSTTV